MSASSRVRLTRMLENNGYGAAPSSGAMTVVRRTGGAFQNNSVRNPSEEVRSDLQTYDSPREDYNASGSIEDEWCYGVHDDEMADAMLSTSTGGISLTGLTLTAAASDNSLTRSAGNWTSDGVVVGAFYQFGGLSTNSTVRARVVTVSSATKIILDTANVTLVDEGPVGSCTAKTTSYLRMGTTARNVHFEELHAGISSTELWHWIGGVCTGWEWGFSHPGKVRTTFNYSFKNGQYNATTAGNGTVTAYATNKVLT